MAPDDGRARVFDPRAGTQDQFHIGEIPFRIGKATNSGKRPQSSGKRSGPDMQTRAKTYRTVILAVLGISVMVTPLALWAAWSQTMFVAVLANGGVSALFYCILARRWDEGFPQRRLADPVSGGADDAAPAPDNDVTRSRIRVLAGDPLVWIGLAILLIVWWLVRS